MVMWRPYSKAPGRLYDGRHSRPAGSKARNTGSQLRLIAKRVIFASSSHDSFRTGGGALASGKGAGLGLNHSSTISCPKRL